MKKKDKVTVSSYRISDHKIITVKRVETKLGESYGIEQIWSDDVMPYTTDTDRELKLVGNITTVKMGLTLDEFHAILGNFLRYRREYEAKHEEDK